MKPTVFIHTNHRQYLGALVSAHSLRRNSQHADRFDLIDRSIGRIASARRGVEQHLALHRGA